MGSRRVLLLAALGGAVVGGCSAPAEDAPLEHSQEPLTAVCQANVKGVGLVDTETKYLPSVVHCENGGAPTESLKAQAVAARTYLYYKMETAGSIADGTSDQVYSCGSAPTAAQIKAVADTAGQVLRYKGTTICAFFVAGGAGSPPGCVGSAAAATEKYVTYNEGKSGAGIEQTTLGWVSPTNDRNRGCFSQLGSRCLADAGRPFDEILRFYYGADITLETATGPCVPTKPTDAGVDAAPDASVDSAVADAAPKDTGAPDTAASDGGADVADAKDGGDAGPVDLTIQGSCQCGAAGTSRTGRWPATLACLLLVATLRRRGSGSSAPARGTGSRGARPRSR